MHPADNETTSSPSKKTDCDFEHDNGEDFDQLHIPPVSGDDLENERFPT